MEVDTYFIRNGQQTILKDPAAELEYSINFTDWLALVTDTLATVTWTNSSNMTKLSQSNTTTVATAKYSGGLIGGKEWATCRIVTAAGRVDERTIYFQMVQR